MEQQPLLEQEFDPDMVIDVQKLVDDALSKLNTVQKIEVIMIILNFTSKTMALYLVFVNFNDVFSQNTLLLFSYILYALLEVVAFGAAFAVILTAKIMRMAFQINTFYLDNFICMPILYSILKFCLIVTFFVQSVTLILFSKFQHWKYPFLLIVSLMVILILSFSRIVLMFGGRFGYLSQWFDFEFIFRSLAPEKIAKAYQLSRQLITGLYDAYESMNPQFREYVNQARQYRQKTIEMKENYEYVANYLQQPKQQPIVDDQIAVNIPEVQQLQTQ